MASAASLFLGACASAVEGAIAWGWLALTISGILFLEAAKNASGEVFDFDSGVDSAVEEVDRSPFSGGKRVIVDGLLTRRQTAVAALVFYTLGVGIGLAIVVAREPGVLWLGAAGVLLAYFYHAPPVKLSYRGLGEVAVALVYGPLICCGTFLVQRHTITALPLIVSLPLGLLIGAFLWVNEFPDFKADAAGGKRTLVVRLGRVAASRVFLALLLLAFLGIALLPALGFTPAIAGLAGLPHAALAGHRLLAAPTSTPRIIAAQRWMLLSFVLAALGMGAGLLLAGR